MAKLVYYHPRQNRSKKWIYMLKWKDETGKWRYKNLMHFDEKKAQREASQLAQRLKSTDDRMRLTELLAEDLQRMRTKHAESTLTMTKARMECLIEAIGNKYIDDVQYHDCEYFQNWLQEERALNSYSTNTYVKMVKAVFSRAVKRRWLERSPFFGLDHVREPENEIRVYRPEELQALLQAAPTVKFVAAVLLARFDGLRRGEVFNLTVKDVDFSSKRIHVQSKLDTKETWKWVSKSRKRRTLPLPENLANVLLMLQMQLPKGQPYLLITPQRYQHLLTLKGAGQLTERVRTCPVERFSAHFQKIRKKAGLPDGTFHDLRKTCITEWAYRKDLKPQDVRILAGHGSLSTTMKYYVAVEKQELVDRANSLMDLLRVCCAPQN